MLNNLELSTPSIKQFPLIKILKNLPEFNSLYETALITINDFFVNKFLEKKLHIFYFYQIYINFLNHLIFINLQKFQLKYL